MRSFDACVTVPSPPLSQNGFQFCQTFIPTWSTVGRRLDCTLERIISRRPPMPNSYVNVLGCCRHNREGGRRGEIIKEKKRKQRSNRVDIQCKCVCMCVRERGCQLVFGVDE